MARSQRRGPGHSKKCWFRFGYFWLSLIIMIALSWASLAIAQDSDEPPINHLPNIWMLFQQHWCFL